MSVHLEVRQPAAILLVALSLLAGRFLGDAVAASAAVHLDPSFGHRGTVLTSVPHTSLAIGGAVPASGGETVVVGNTFDPSNESAGGRVVFARYRRDGRLSKRFGRSGMISTRIPGGTVQVAGLVRLASNRLLIAGTLSRRGTPVGRQLVVARFLPTGHLDHSYGDDGVRIIGFGADSAFADDLAAYPDGAAVVVGSLDNTLSQSTTLGDIVAARLTSAGNLDTTFARDGVADLAPTNSDESLKARSVELPGDGTVLIGGNFSLVSRDRNAPVVARLLADGTPDAAVNSLQPGMAFFGGGLDRLATMTRDPRSGRLYLVGDQFQESDSSRTFFISAINSALSADRGFADGRGVTLSFRGTSNDVATSAVVDAKGRLLAVGLVGNGENGVVGFSRLRRSGQIDRAFGRSGKLRVRFRRAVRGPRALIQYQRGRVLAVGDSGGRNSAFALARFTSSASDASEIHGAARRKRSE